MAETFATSKPVTLSIGASLIDQAPATLAGLIEQDDAAPYASKRAGGAGGE